MKKIWMICLISCVGLLLLSACNSEKDENKKDDKPETEEENKTGEKESEDPEKVEEVEDQLELSIGDTGFFDSPLGTYEITVEQAELLGKEFEGVESTRDDIILLKLTVKNTSDEQLLVDELIESMEVADDLEGAGSGDNGIGFDSIDPLKGSIEADEEITGHFLTTVNESDTYYFRKNPGTVKSSDSNQVIWIIEKDDLEK